MLDLLARLSEMHSNPAISDPALLSPTYLYTSNPDEDEGDEEEQALRSGANEDEDREIVALGQNGAVKRGDAMETDEGEREWKGIWKDVGIFSEEEWKGIMTLCLKSMSESSFCCLSAGFLIRFGVDPYILEPSQAFRLVAKRV